MSEHEHHHNHSHSHNVSGKNLFITIILNIIITLSQVIGGILSGSLALMSDALHNFSDVLALVLTYWTNKIAEKDKNNYNHKDYKERSSNQNQRDYGNNNNQRNDKNNKQRNKEEEKNHR